METTVVISARPMRDRDRRPSREKVIYLIANPGRYKYRGEAESLDFLSRKYATTPAREKSHRARAFSLSGFYLAPLSRRFFALIS